MEVTCLNVDYQLHLARFVLLFVSYRQDWVCVKKNKKMSGWFVFFSGSASLTYIRWITTDIVLACSS